MYDVTDSKTIFSHEDISIFTVSEKGEKNNNLIAKKYIYKKETSIENVWF